MRSVGSAVAEVGGGMSTPSTSETREKRPGYSWKMRCGEVVADDGEACGMPEVDMDDAG